MKYAECETVNVSIYSKSRQLSSILILKYSQFKNDAIQFKKLLDFEIAAFLRHPHSEGKKAATSKLKSFSADSHFSDIDCALTAFSILLNLLAFVFICIVVLAFLV